MKDVKLEGTNLISKIQAAVAECLEKGDDVIVQVPQRDMLGAVWNVVKFTCTKYQETRANFDDERMIVTLPNGSWVRIVSAKENG